MLKVEVEGMDEAQRDLAQAESGTRDEMRQAAASAVTAQWVPALRAAAGGRQQQKLLVTGAGAEVAGDSFTLHAARGPALSGGLDHWYAVDYGMTPRQIVAPNRRRTRRLPGGGRVSEATQVWVGRGLPPRVSKGRVIFPTIGERSQDFVTAWVEGLMGQFDSSRSLDVTDGDELGQVSGSWR